MTKHALEGRRLSRLAFTLLELMISMVLLSAILLVIFSITQQTGNAWKRAQSKIEAFQSARLAFGIVTRTLGEATLNTYYDYFDSGGRPSRDPSYSGVHHYGRQSDLHFISGKALVSDQVTHSIFFQTPSGYTNDTRFQNMDTLLNACGFYIIHGVDRLRPSFLDSPNAPSNAPRNNIRYRLMQFLQPSQKLKVYDPAKAPTDWFIAPLESSQQLAENVIAMVVLPRYSSGDASVAGSPLTDDYEYDSRESSHDVKQLPTENQLPPVVEVILVAIDEASAKRLGEQELEILKTPLFQDSSQLDADIAFLEKELIRRNLTYRIFRSTMAIRNSKWTS